MLIQAIDGRLYSNPVIWGEDVYIDFPIADIPEIHVRAFKNTRPSSAKARMRRFLREQEFDAKLAQEPVPSNQTFPPKYNGFRKSYTSDLEIREPIPIPQIHEGDTDTRFGTYMVWQWLFGIDDVMSIFKGSDPSNFLRHFALGWAGSKEDFERSRRGVKKWIVKQLPSIIEAVRRKDWEITRQGLVVLAGDSGTILLKQTEGYIGSL